MEIGFTSTTFRQIKNLEKIVDIAKRAGSDCIEWGGDIHVKTIDDAKKQKCCVKKRFAYFFLRKLLCCRSNDYEEWTRICKIAFEMGAKGLRVWLGKKGSAKTGTSEKYRMHWYGVFQLWFYRLFPLFWFLLQCRL